jgi:cobalamin biosynthesis Co2+ chelatase CbiK
MAMRNEQAWSLLDPKPVLLYVEKVDDYVVYWNGVAMPHSMALCMAMESIGIYATPEMKSVLEKNYRKIYYANGFDTRAWDQKVEASPLYPYLKRIMVEHLKKVMENRTPQEVLGWFNYDRARKEEYV